MPFNSGPTAGRHSSAIPFFAVLFTSPIGVADDSLLDAFFDLSGGAFIGLGLILRMWARGHAGRQRIFPQRVPTRLPTSGPYRYTRQPLLLGNVLVSLGLVLFAENGNGFVLIPVVLLMLYRFTVPFEEARLAERFGGAYAAYRANVPVVPRWTAAMTATASGKPSWRSVAAEMPIIAAALLLAALIGGVPFFPQPAALTTRTRPPQAGPAALVKPGGRVHGWCRTPRADLDLALCLHLPGCYGRARPSPEGDEPPS